MSNRRQNRRGQRGAVAVETAFSLITLTFVAMAGIYFADAMSVRQRLTAATSRAARICARFENADNVGACVEQQVRGSLGAATISKCTPFSIEPEEVVLRANLSMVTARVSCGFTNQIGTFLQFQAGEAAMTLTAQATMPVAR